MHKTCIEKNYNRAAKGFKLTKTTISKGVVRVRASWNTILPLFLKLDSSLPMIQQYQKPIMALRINESSFEQKSGSHKVRYIL